MSATKESAVTNYIVLHHAITLTLGGSHVRGDVLSAEAVGDDAERLVSLRAIRPASADEAKLSHVNLKSDDSGKDRSFDEQIVTLGRERDSLTNKNREQAGRINELIAELNQKQAVIDHLRTQLQGAGVAPAPLPSKPSPEPEKPVSEAPSVTQGPSTASLPLPADFPVRDKLVAEYGEGVSVEDVASLSDEDLLAIKGIGQQSVTAIRAYRVK